MFAKMSLRLRVLTIGVILTSVPIVVISAVVYWQNHEMVEVAKAESSKLAHTNLSDVAQGVYRMCALQHAMLEKDAAAKGKAANTQADVSQIRRSITDIVVGKTGYAYVLTGSGEKRGKYIISLKGQRDGESVWEAKDDDGKLVVQSIIAKAKGNRNGECDFERYPWRNQGESRARVKIAAITYFEPWDWVIGVCSYEDEFQEAGDKLAAIGQKGHVVLGVVLAVSALIAAVIWFFATQSLVKPLRMIFKGLETFSACELADAGKKFRVSIDSMQQGTREVASAANLVASAAQALALGSSEQAAAAEETSSSSEQMASMTRQNAENALEARRLSEAARCSADKGFEAMSRMSVAIAEIQRSSTDTSKIMKVIDEIAFQTNLLALNAAVEAARAGEAGKSFAVVAEEVRNLAQRSAEAARNTAALIEESVKSADKGVQISREVSEALQGITEKTRKANELVTEIAAASNDQAHGIGQINTAIGQMGTVTQQNAANAEESASAAEELNNQVEGLNRVVGQLRGLLEGAEGEYATSASGHGGRQAPPLHDAFPYGNRRRSEKNAFSPADTCPPVFRGSLTEKRDIGKNAHDDLPLPKTFIPLDDEEAVLSQY